MKGLVWQGLLVSLQAHQDRVGTIYLAVPPVLFEYSDIFANTTFPTARRRQSDITVKTPGLCNPTGCDVAVFISACHVLAAEQQPVPFCPV